MDLINAVNPSFCVVGSYTLNLRYAKDIDIICAKDRILIPTTGDDYIQSGIYEGKKIEFLLTDNQESLQILLSDFSRGKLNIIELCYILKAGHIHIAGRDQANWEKHIHDYHILSMLVNPIALKSWVSIHRKIS